MITALQLKTMIRVSMLTRFVFHAKTFLRMTKLFLFIFTIFHPQLLECFLTDKDVVAFRSQ